MVKDMMSKIENAGIPYAHGVYKGAKDTLIICSKDKKFLTSL